MAIPFSPDPPRGFTLQEMMLVVALIGIISAIGVPRVSTLIRERGATTAVQAFGRAVQGARDTALDARRCVHVTRASASSIKRDTLAIDGAGACTSTIEATDTVSFNASHLDIPSGLDVTFNSHGGVETTNDFVTVTANALTDGGAKAHSFRVYRLLGIVRRSP